MALHNYIWKRSYDGVTFVEFDRNPNFIPNDILPYVVARSGNHENCSLCWIDFIYDEIEHSLIWQ
jgi:hypothetical protein